MKKIIISILIILSGQLYANTTSRTEELVSIQKQIETFLNTSDMPLYKDLVVMVEFKLTENNEIKVISIASFEQEILIFIRKSLNKKVLLIEKSNITKSYTIPVRFTAI